MKETKARERYQSLSKEEKGKSNNMVVNDTKLCQKMKTKACCWVKKKYYKIRKKRLIIFIRNYSHLENQQLF